MAKKKSGNECEDKNNKGDDEKSSTKNEEEKKKKGGGGKEEEKNNICVESVKRVEDDLNKLTVIGNLDPSKIRELIERKTKKKVEIISPSSKKDKDKKTDADGNDKKNSSGDKPANEKKSKDPPVTTALLKVPLHCDGCIQKIQKLVYKTKGYMEMSIDKQKEVVTVKGAMDMKALAALLSKKLKRNVEIVPAKKEKGDGEKKEKEKSDGGDKAADGGGKSGGKVEGNKMEQNRAGYVYEYGYQYWQEPGYMPSSSAHAPQLFSDENPNACVVM